MKPWEPPEQNLYPILSDLLDDWNATSRETFDGIYVVGTRWAPSTHELKNFLAKSQIPYRWMEPGATSDPRLRAAVGEAPTDLPVVIFSDGSILRKPSLPDVAAKLGLVTSPSREFYDVIIVGGRPRRARLCAVLQHRRAANHPGRTRSCRRPGRTQFANRKLPGISLGIKRCRSCPPWGFPSEAVWHGSTGSGAGRFTCRRWRIQGRETFKRPGTAGPQCGYCRRSAVAPAEYSGNGKIDRVPESTTARRTRNGFVVQGRGRLHYWGSEFRGSGGGPFL